LGEGSRASDGVRVFHYSVAKLTHRSAIAPLCYCAALLLRRFQFRQHPEEVMPV